MRGLPHISLCGGDEVTEAGHQAGVSSDSASAASQPGSLGDGRTPSEPPECTSIRWEGCPERAVLLGGLKTIRSAMGPVSTCSQQTQQLSLIRNDSIRGPCVFQLRNRLPHICTNEPLGQSSLGESDTAHKTTWPERKVWLEMNLSNRQHLKHHQQIPLPRAKRSRTYVPGLSVFFLL